MKDDLIVDNITCSFGGRSILKDVSFTVKEGTVHGLLGPNGAGKSTTFKLIANVYPLEAGHIKLGKKNIDSLQMGFTIEDPILIDELTTFEFLYYLAELRKCKDPQKVVQDTIKKCDLEKVQNKLVNHLSTGFKQRVSIAQAILHNPKIVLLDEPTNGLDPQAKIDIRNLILQLKKDHTVLISSHLLLEMGKICDDITILSNGSVITSGPISLLDEKLHSVKRLFLEFEGSDEGFIDFLQSHSWLKELKRIDNGKLSLLIDSFHDVRHDIIKHSFQYNIKLSEIYYQHKSLEDVFLEVTDKS